MISFEKVGWFGLQPAASIVTLRNTDIAPRARNTQRKIKNIISSEQSREKLLNQQMNVEQECLARSEGAGREGISYTIGIYHTIQTQIHTHSVNKNTKKYISFSYKVICTPLPKV